MHVHSCDREGMPYPRPPHPARAALVALGITNREAARQLGVNAAVLGRWLNHRERIPAARRAELAELIGWPEAELFHDDHTEDTAHAR